MAAKQILVIDDEPDIVDFITMVLQDHGFDTLSAHNGQQGLALARGHQPDLITLDITMPGMSGVQVFKELRADSRITHIPVFVVTGVQEFREMMFSRSIHPPEGFMEKPIDPDLLLRKINRILGET